MATSHPDDQGLAGSRLVGHRLLDRYVVGDRIARGGMGVVFRGIDERLHRPICVKVFQPLDPGRPEYATVLEHFVQEAFTLSRLSHPNTLRIYDFGYLDATAGTGPFFVTEYADGGTLTELVLARGRLSLGEALRILEPVVGALGEAHDAGVVHRDIKPSNILFTRAGAGLIPKLCDFSIAKAHGDFPNRAQDTNVSVPLYSLSWAAPEQLTERVVGPPSDVFAMALTTLFMLTGTVVYPGEDLLQGYALRSRGFPYREEVIGAADLPQAVIDVLLAACAESPDERYPSVEAYLDALREASELAGASLPEADGDPTVAIPDVDRDPTGSASYREAPTGPGLAPGTTPGDAAMETATLRVVDSPAPDVAAPAAATRPRLRLSSLEAAAAIVGNRRLRAMEVGTTPIELPTDAATAARVRITPVDVAGATLHLKGLNCFARPRGGRPSSGLDVAQSTSVDLLTPELRPAATLHVVIARPIDGLHVFELPGATISLPLSLARWAAILDVEGSAEILLLFRRDGRTS